MPKLVDDMTDEEANSALVKYRLELMRPIITQWLDDWDLRNIELLSLIEKGGDLE